MKIEVCVFVHSLSIIKSAFYRATAWPNATHGISVAKRSRTNTPLMRNEEIPNSQSQTTYFDLLKLEFNVDINVT